MPKLRDHIESALNETRVLLLGGQVLLGFSYRPFFEPAFERLSQNAQIAHTASVVILTLALVWLTSPPLYHQIADSGENTARFQQFTTNVLDWGLLPVAFGLGINAYVIASFMNLPYSAALGTGTGGFALAFWYGFTWLHRDPNKQKRVRNKLVLEEGEQSRNGGTELKTKVKNLLLECRTVLPGVQAMLGFQLTTFFMQGFEKLPQSSQMIHMGGLAATAVATVLIITPAAYHRIAEAGEDSEQFHRIGSNLLLSSMVFLGLGLVGDLVVIIRKMGFSLLSSSIVGGCLLLASYALWFGWALWKKLGVR